MFPIVECCVAREGIWSAKVCVCVCVCVCLRACVRACVRAFVRESDVHCAQACSALPALAHVHKICGCSDEGLSVIANVNRLSMRTYMHIMRCGGCARGSHKYTHVIYSLPLGSSDAHGRRLTLAFRALAACTWQHKPATRTGGGLARVRRAARRTTARATPAVGLSLREKG